ncbi:MAG TPA: hypothetical protein VL737_04645 [Candidatus Pristimantibacillus sp.]|nr:hypothetical protein [Candidatus Pristimantibacillus sp.]
MTEVSARVGWADTVRTTPAAPETRGQDLPAIDKALFFAFEGDFRLAERLPDAADQRAVSSAARCFGVAVPEGLDSRPLSFSAVADRLESSQSVTNLFLAAEKFSGDRTRGEKVKRVGATAAKGVTLLVDLPLSAASTVAEKLDYNKTAQGVEAASGLVRLAVQVPFERLHEAGPNKLFHAVRRFLQERYGVNYNNNPRLALGWLRATVLGAAAQSPYTSNETMQELARDFMGASQGFRLREHAESKRLAEDAGIPRLRVSLSSGADIREAAVRFLTEQAEAKAAREQAARDYFKPKPSLRPSGNDLEILRMAADTYNDELSLPYGFVVAGMRDAAVSIGRGTDEYGESIIGLINLMSVALERSLVANDPQAGHFSALFMQYVRSHGFTLAAHIRNNPFVFSQNLASTGYLRLASNMATRPDIWGFALGDDAKKLGRTLIQAAFDWFDYPYETFQHMPEVVNALHRAHVQAVSGLAGPPALNSVRRSRAAALLSALPSEKWKREQTEKSLPRAALAQLEAARKLLGRR